MLILDAEDNSIRYFSKRLMCPTTGLAYREPAPHNFSFNSAQGACPKCKGLGHVNVIDWEKVCPDPLTQHQTRRTRSTRKSQERYDFLGYLCLARAK